MRRFIKYVFPFAFVLICTYLFAVDLLPSDSSAWTSKVVVIDSVCNLHGDTLRLQKGSKLVFKGGKIDDGVIVGNDTRISIKQKTPAFGLNLKIEGRWDVKDVYDKWFEFDSSSDFVANRIIRNILALSNDDKYCHIIFNEPRTYYYQLEYKGRPDIWNVVSANTVNGKTVKNWDDIYNEQFSSLRIFTIPSNTRLTVNNTLKMLPTKAGAYFVFWEYDKENVTIDGKGTIYGDCKEHIYYFNKAGKYSYSGEWGMIFICIKCRNFIFKDLTISNAHGDGIVFRGSRYEKENGSRRASGLLIENVNIRNARRNGISLGVTNAVIKNCCFEGCGIDSIYGTAPKAAIDFEPDMIYSYPEIGNENVKMQNCIFKNNKHDVSSTNNNLPKYGKTATIISNCIFTAPVRLNPTYWLKFVNCKIPSFTNWKGEITDDTRIMNVEFENCEIDTLPSVLKKEAWKNKFTRIKIGKEI